jgi:TatA/E family protein of Tat protein translocase
MFNIGPLELLIILVLALIVVGPQKLPEVGRSIGRGLREFRRAQDEVRRSLQIDEVKEIRRDVKQAFDVDPRDRPKPAATPAAQRAPRPAPSPAEPEANPAPPAAAPPAEPTADVSRERAPEPPAEPGATEA